MLAKKLTALPNWFLPLEGAANIGEENAYGLNADSIQREIASVFK